MLIRTNLTALTKADVTSVPDYCMLAYIAAEAAEYEILYNPVSKIAFVHDPADAKGECTPLPADSPREIDNNYGWNFGYRKQILSETKKSEYLNKYITNLRAKYPFYTRNGNALEVEVLYEGSRQNVIVSGTDFKAPYTNVREMGRALALCYTHINEITQPTESGMKNYAGRCATPAEPHLVEVEKMRKQEAEEVKKYLERMKSIFK